MDADITKDATYASISFSLDDRELNMSARVYDINTWFVDIGAYGATFAGTIGWFVSIFSYQLYKNSILGRLFFIESLEDKADGMAKGSDDVNDEIDARKKTLHKGSVLNQSVQGSEQYVMKFCN